MTATDARATQTDADRRADVAPVRLRFPLPRTHCGFPLGNGLFGALVWGEADTLRITINRADFWDHRGGERLSGERIYERMKADHDPQDARSMNPLFEPMVLPRPSGAFRNTRLPMGRFDLTLREGLTLTRGALDVTRGALTVDAHDAEGEPACRLTVALHPQQNALLIHDPAQAVARVQPRPAWEWVGEQLRSRDYQPPTVWDDEARIGWAQDCPDDPAMAAVCAHGDEALHIAMEPGDDAAAARKSAAEAIAVAQQFGHRAFLDDVCQWWSAYWRDLPRVDVPDAYFSDFLTMAQFRFGGATSPQSPLPSSLQGPWCEEYQLPPWSCDYHFNVNIQQIYTLAFSIGKTEHLLPLFDMLERNADVFRRSAKCMVGIDDGILLTHTMDDRGLAAGGVGPGAVIDHAVSGWTAQLYWLYYKHTGDTAFLRERALPFMTGVMRVYEAMLEWRGGVPRLPLSISAEYGHPLPNGDKQRIGPDASYQFACMHMLADALIEGAQTLGDTPRESWQHIREHAPHFTLVGEPGDERIAIWEAQDLEISHRHHSHLACIYPFDTLGERSERTQAIVDNSLNRWLEVGMSDWSEWCLPWAAIIQAREGYTESPHLLLKLCRDLFVNEGLANVYIPRFAGFTLHGLERKTGPLETCEMMQLDGNMGMVTALYEMLVHTHRGTTRFFPAVPEAWRDVSFEDVRLPGPMRAGGEKRDGVVRRITLTSEHGGRVRIDVPGYTTLTVTRGSHQQQMTLPADVTLQAGERFEARPA